MAYPVFDLHCDTADRIGWATLDLDLRFTAGTDGYFPGDETHLQDFDLIEGNACAISLAKIGNTPWAQCFATFVPDEIPTAHAARFQAQIMAHMSGQAMLNHDRMVNVRSAADIRPALKDGKVACIHTIENATFFAEDPALIEVLKSLGVLMSSLSWNAQGPLASGPCAFQLSDDMSTPRLLSTSISAGSSAKNVAFSMVWMQATLPSLSAGRMSAALRTLTMRSWLSIAWPLMCAMICAWKRAAWAVGISSGTNVAKHCAHGVLPIFASEMAQALPSMRSKSCRCVSSPGK